MRGDDRGKLAVIEFPFSPPIFANNLASFKRQLPPADSYELDSGPEGMAVDADGVLTWKPKSKVEAGSYPIKVRLKIDGKLSFHRQKFEVVSAQTDSEMRLESDDAILSRSTRHDGIGVSDRNRWLDINPDGEITREVRFPNNYSRIIETSEPKGFVALGDKKVDFLSDDGETLQQSIELDGLEPLRILRENNGQSYLVSTKDPAAGDVLQTYPIIRVDPKTGSFERLSRVMGSELISNRAGDLLLASISHRTHHSVGFLDTRIVDIDLLMGYRHTGQSIGPDEIECGRLAQIQSLTLSSDDQYLAAGARSMVVGGQMSYGRFPIYKYPNFERPSAVVVTGGNLRDINAHPQIQAFAVLAVEGSFGQELSKLKFVKPNGEELDHWLPNVELPEYGSKVCFSGNGKSLFLKARDMLGRVKLSKFDLALEAEELAAIESGPPSPKPAFSNVSIAAADDPASTQAPSGSAQGLAQWQFEKLGQMQQNPIPSEHLTRFLGASVAVVIGGEGKIGTGFFLTGDGYLLTAAHCLADFGPTMVACHVSLPYEKTEMVRKAIIVDVDDELDLALLKIDADVNLWSLRMRQQQAAQGEQVYVIGHPGMGQISLENTLTSGLASSAKRNIEGNDYLQISAPVNPGNSGGPVLDERGNFIGMVSLKANLEGASFAVPSEKIAAFLERTVLADQTEEPSSEPRERANEKAREDGFHLISDFTFKGDIGFAVIKDTEDPFTGTMVYLAPTGELIHKVPYVEGLPHGEMLEFNRAGVKKRTQHFVRGEKGMTVYYYDSGNIREEQNLHQGKPHGIQRTYDDAPFAVREAISYQNGVVHGPQYRMDASYRVVNAAFFADGQMAISRTFNYYSPEDGDKLLELTKAGDIQLVQRMVEGGESINRPDGEIGPIHAAIESSYIYLVRGIIELGADANRKNDDGKRPIDLELAKNDPSSQIVKLLLDAKVDTSGIDPKTLEAIVEKGDE